MIRLAAIALMLALVTSAHATHPCVQQVQVQPAYAVPVYQNIYYSVAPQLQLEAVVERIVQQRLQAIQQANAATTPTPNTPEPVQQNVLAANCAKCHSGATPKGGLLLDGTAPLSAELGWKIVNAIQLPKDAPGHMPPDVELDNKTKGEILQTLNDLFARKEE